MFRKTISAKNNALSNSFYLLLIFVGLSFYLFTQSILSLAVIVAIIVVRYDTIYPFLIIFAVVEGLVLINGNATITRYLILLYIGKTIFDILLKRFSTRFDRNGISLIVLMIVFILGFFNITLNPHPVFIGNISFEKTLFLTILITAKIIMAILLYWEFKCKSIEESTELISRISMAISIGLVLISVFSVLNPKTLYGGIGITRQTIEDTDPNELASFIVAFLPYPLYVLFRKKSFLKIVGIIAIILSTIIMALTLSRGGMVTFIVVMLIMLILLIRNTNNKARYIVSIIILVLLFYSINKITFATTINRFVVGYSEQGMQGLTSNRWDIWISGISATIQHRLFFGFGTSLEATQMINFLNTGRDNVMHSILIGMYVQFGLIGLFAYLYMIQRIIRGFMYLVKRKYFLIVLPLVSFISLQLSGLTLELEYREIVWIFTGISLGIISMIYDQKKKHL